MKDYDFDSVVENAISAGEAGVSKKKELEGVMNKFITTTSERLSSHLGKKITLKREPAIIDDGSSSSSMFSFVSHSKRSETAFDVFVLDEGERGVVIRKYKLFSYEYDEEKVLPVILRYGEASIACTSEEKIIEALGAMFRAKVVQLIEWCNKT